MSSKATKPEIGPNEEEAELRRGPWTLEEDSLLIHCIALHGEGRWNMLAKSAGLKRTGKSCRLRWLNYLKPDIKRGNLSPQEQLLILELHSKWGNRWSKIAQCLPGRTDNEIKNYWRTRVQKQARQLNIESGSDRFIDAVRCFWMPRLLQKMEQNSSSSSSSSAINMNSDNSAINVPSFSTAQGELTNIVPNYQTSTFTPNNNSNLNFPDQYCSLQLHEPFEISKNPTAGTDIPQVLENYNNDTVWFNDQAQDHSYGMEGLNLEAFSKAESDFGMPQFDYDCQSSESDQWVLSSNVGEYSLWNLDDM